MIVALPHTATSSDVQVVGGPMVWLFMTGYTVVPIPIIDYEAPDILMEPTILVDVLVDPFIPSDVLIEPTDPTDRGTL